MENLANKGYGNSLPNPTIPPVVWAFLKLIIAVVVIYLIVSVLLLVLWNVSLPLFGVPTINLPEAAGLAGLWFLFLASLYVTFRNQGERS